VQLQVNIYSIQKAVLLTVLLLGGSITFYSQVLNNLPQLVKKDGTTQLYVEGRPFLILGGETGNSSASDMAYMRPYWSKLQAMNLNTLLAPVYWELMEPEEGKFDFSLVDSLLSNARRHNLKLVLLWFGTWKNSMSCYVPLWMKKDPARFNRTQDKNGRSQEIISCFSKPALEADKKAFTALMKYLRDKDDKNHTVVMVQVENEIGMLPTAREISKTASAYFNDDVPAALISWLKKNKDSLEPPLYERWKQTGFATLGSWTKIFGEGLATDEIFQAWHYARYANAVALAGKSAYNIPMYVNAALNRPNVKPGDYPSAGPLPHVLDIWKAAAPAIDIFSPDFYTPDTKYWCDLYAKKGNPLFVPEMRLEPSCAQKVFYIMGHYKAIGFSPFSIEDAAGLPETGLQKSYEVLQQLSHVITAHTYLVMDGALLDKANPVQQIQMGGYQLKISHDNTLGWTAASRDSSWSMGGVLIIQTGKDDFIVAGTGIVITFSCTDNSRVANIASADEVQYENGKEIKSRRMNGDQDHQGRHIRIPDGQGGIQKVSMYQSPAKIND
jgi:beta-galactosidase GanA